MSDKDFDLDSDIDATLGAAPTKPAAQQDFDLDADIDSTLSAAPQQKQSHVIEMPTQHIEGTVPLQPGPAEAPKKSWFSRFLPNRNAVLAGAAQGATLNFGDEGAAALSTLADKIVPAAKDPEGFTREYAAGSQYEDMRGGLDRENTKLRDENPGSFIAGQLVGGAPAALATGSAVANVARPVLGAGLGLGAQSLAAGEAIAGGGVLGGASGAGAAQPGQRLESGVRGAVEGAVTSGALHATGVGMQDAANNLKNTSNALLTQTFMTPAQRHKYQIAKGKGSLDQLGQDAWDTGLFGGKLRRLLPNRARDVADRAARNMEQSGADIGKFEQDLADRGVNPDVNIRPIVDDLRSAAADETVPALKSEGVVDTINKGADLLEQPSTEQVSGAFRFGDAPKPAAPPLPEPPGAGPTQLEMPTPRAMPSRQLGLNLPAAEASRPTPAQMQMNLPRQQPGTQLGLGLEPQQAPLRLPPAEAVKQTRPQMTLDALPVRLPSGGTAQETMFLGTEPAKPPAAPAAPAEAVQQSLELPAPQVGLPMDLSSKPLPFRPEARPAEQANLPLQYSLPLPTPTPKPAPPAPPTLPSEQQLPDAAANVTRDTLPFTDAMRLKRFLGKEINWTQNPNTPGTRGEDIVNKTSWKGIGDQIDEALRNDPGVDQNAFQQYGQDKKTFHTAATTFDPALRMAEREGEIGLGARDFLAAGALGGGPIGGVAAVANKTMAGSLPSTGAVLARGGSATAGGLSKLLKQGAKVSPLVLARQQHPDASPAEVKNKANDKVKQDLSVLLKKERTQ